MLYMFSLRTNGVSPTGKQQFQIPFFTFISDQDLTIILKAEGLSGYMWVDLSFLLPIRLAQQLNFMYIVITIAPVATCSHIQCASWENKELPWVIFHFSRCSHYSLILDLLSLS